MIVLINGPFGVGKTTTARLLVERLPRARLYNPEHIGAALRPIARLVGPVADYQDLALWRLLVPQIARIARLDDRTLVVPISLWRRDYLEQIRGGLQRADRDLRCFQLTASESVLRGRILGRPDAEGGHAWCLAHLRSGLAMTGDRSFGMPVDTDGRSPDAVATAILDLLQAPPRSL